MYWFIGIGILFILTGISSIFSDFSVFLGGLILGVPLLIVGLLKLSKRKPMFFPLLKEKKFKEAFQSLSSRNNSFVYPQSASTGNLVVDTFHLSGVSYYRANIMKLANTNPQWTLTVAQHLANGKAGRKVYRYNFTNSPVELVPEPKNPHDKNAIAVRIAGQLVGYISREQNQYVAQLLKGGRIKFISGFIGGGENKYIAHDGSTSHSDDAFSVNIRIGHA